MKNNTIFFVCAISLFAGILACNFTGTAAPNLEETAQALSDAILLTATAEAGNKVDPQAGIPTVLAEATARSLSSAATQTAQALLGEQALTATAEVFSPIRAELPKYGIDPNQGRPGWIHPPVQLEVEGYMQYDYANEFIGTVAQDFVVSADITWNTVTGLSGCGFVLRSDGNQEALNQYLTIATRGASGHVVFGTMANGELVTGQDIYAYGLDPNFDWQNDATNRLTVVARGNNFSIYTNETFIGEVDPSAPPPQPIFPPAPPEPEDNSDQEAMAAYQAARAAHQTVVTEIQSNYQQRLQAYKEADTVYERGFIAMVALSESGRTVCQFDNAWLWLIDE